MSAHDYGQYPWGRNLQEGPLASLSKLLGIDETSGSSNCCLFVHLLVGILDANLFSVRDLFNSHEDFLRKYLTSNVMRADVEVVPDFLDTLELHEKICVRFIFLHDDGLFYFCSQSFGNPNATIILLVHAKNHFFLAKQYSAPTSNSVVCQQVSVDSTAKIRSPSSSRGAREYIPPKPVQSPISEPSVPAVNSSPSTDDPVTSCIDRPEITSWDQMDFGPPPDFSIEDFGL